MPSKEIHTGRLQRTREFKGRSLLENLDDYVAIDLETTGLDPSCDEIIEVGAVRVRCGVVQDSFESLCSPDNPVNEFITELTGITNDMLDGAPGIEPVLGDLLTFIGDDVVVGHNVNFDVNFIYDSAIPTMGVAFTNNYIDTMRFARRLVPGLENYRLPTLLRSFGIQADISHRGISDAISAMRCYEYLRILVLNN